MIILSNDAKAYIQDITSKHNRRHGHSAVPALMWIDTVHNPGIESQVAIGFYSDRELVKDLIENISGIEIVLAMSDEHPLGPGDTVVELVDGTLQLRLVAG